MEKLTLQYIATQQEGSGVNSESKVLKALRVLCDAEGIDLVPYLPSQPLSGFLLIIEPVIIKKDLFALTSTWKPWLMEKAPDTRLVFAGFFRASHDNFLNLLELPPQLREWLLQRLPVSAYRLQYAGVEERNGHKYDIFQDPWIRFMPLTGRDLRRQMKKFTEGHDRTNSFYQQISRFRKILVDINYLRSADVPFPEKKTVQAELRILQEAAQQEWGGLKNRWFFYKPFFAMMPFHEAFHAINEKMDLLEETVAKLKKTNYIPDIASVDQLRDLVRDELKRYIDYEEHW